MPSSAPPAPDIDPQTGTGSARPTAPAPRRAPSRVSALVVAVGLLLTAVFTVALLGNALDDGGQARSSAGSPAQPRPVTDRLAASIDQARERLRRLPADPATWAALGTAYVEQARVSANPAYYPQAQGAFDRSLQLQPADNAEALIGMGALANARHDFAAARGYAEQALALRPSSVEAYGVLADATTQLGDAEAATAAVQRMLELWPGVTSFTRASYELELHGSTGDARMALERALEAAVTRDELAFCRYYLGELAWNTGDLDGARAQYDQGLAVAPGDPALLAGRAKVLAASGGTDPALAGYAQLTARVPAPQYLLEYGELLESAGRVPEAQAQYLLIAGQQRLAAAQGSLDELTAAQVAADHGDPAEALRLAEAEWGRRQSVFTADALGWALHVAGRDAEALPLVERAGQLGRRAAVTEYHRGMILAALGRADEAISALDAALRTNPHFSPLHAATARQMLDSLGAGR